MPLSWIQDRNSRQIWWLDGVLIESGGSGSTRPNCFGESPPAMEGVHDAVRVRDGRCEFVIEHIDRLIDSSASLGMPVAFNRAELLEALFDVVRANPPCDLLLRLYVVRSGGAGDREGGGLPAVSARIESYPFRGYARRPMTEGFRLVTAPFLRNAGSPHIRHKTLDAGDARRALRLAQESGKDEAIFRNTAGRLVGASCANLHLVLGGTLVTPSIAEGAFPGIVRGAVLEAARDIGLSVDERAVEPGEPLETPEVFLTSTLLGVAPVAEIDGIPLPSPLRSPSIPKLRIRFREIAAERGLFP